MELSKRLRMNAGLVPEGARVADIGCDHGYVSIYLAEKKNCRVIATDVREGPLSTARKNIVAAGLAGQVECRLGDGLGKLAPGEADTLLIAGMGGMLIGRILRENPAVLAEIRTLVLQPQSDVASVRKMLCELRFRIDREAFCTDAGKDYIAIRAIRGAMAGTRPDNGGSLPAEPPYSEAEYRYGRYLPRMRDEDYRSYLVREREKYRNIKKKMVSEKTEGCQARIPEIMHILDLLEQIIWQ